MSSASMLSQPPSKPGLEPGNPRRNSLSPSSHNDLLSVGESPRTTPAPSTPITNGASKTTSDDGIKSPLCIDQNQSPRRMDSIQPPVIQPPSQTGSFMSGGRIPKFDPLEGKLQDMLRYNMERYGGQAFDTLATARRVREILSVHNIGQRLFAKYVLGLSQGTVSELLSKPKSWEKLTEKGRDSYRKMHAWVYDEGAVMLLKSLIPRKSELVRSGGGQANVTSFQPHLSSRDKDMFDRHQPSFDSIAKSMLSGDRRFPPNPFDFKVGIKLFLRKSN